MEALRQRQAREELAKAIVQESKVAVLQPDGELSVSTSTSGDTLAVVVAAGGSIGIDLERPLARRSRKNFLAGLSASCLSTFEFDAFQRLNEAQKGPWLLRRWTAKESHLKRRGSGLLEAPSQLEVKWDPRRGSTGFVHCLAENMAEDGAGSHALRVDTGCPQTYCCLASPRPLARDDISVHRLIINSRYELSKGWALAAFAHKMRAVPP